MGKPGPFHSGSLIPEFIGYGEASAGTETSKYREERKVITTAVVVASESAAAQTLLVFKFVLRTGTFKNHKQQAPMTR